MGYSNIRMTTHYARIQNQKVENDMAILKDKLNSENHNKIYVLIRVRLKLIIIIIISTP